MKQHRNKGSILGFVLVGALLTALVIGGVFAAKRYIAQNQTNDTDSATIAEAPAKETQKPAETNKTTPAASQDNDLQKALEQQAAAEKKAQDQKAASEAATKTTPAPASTPAESPSVPAPTSTASLPTTGPEDSVVAMTGATLLAAAGVAYRRSRALI